jgi:UDP:flavonoid glycosyltransferase YjiC (YdhE family)
VPGAAVPAPVHRFRAGPPALHAVETGDLPLVYLSFGSVAGSLPLFPDLYRAAIAALAPLPVRLLVTIGRDGDRDLLGPLPANVRVEAWMPQDAVLAQAAAVVCHCGSGTTLGALAHGVPIVGVPLFSGDQWNNARRVAATGAGIVIEGATRAATALPGADVVAALPAAVERVLGEPAFRRAARTLASAFAALPPVDRAPAVLERLALARAA